MRALFLPGFTAMHAHFHCHTRLLAKHAPRLHSHFEALGIKTVFYATRWFVTLFAGVLPFDHMLRVWDIVLFDGTEILHTIALRTLEHNQKRYLAAPFADCMAMLVSLQDLPDKPDAFIAYATRRPLPHTLLADLQREYTMEQFRLNALQSPDIAAPPATTPSPQPTDSPTAPIPVPGRSCNSVLQLPDDDNDDDYQQQQQQQQQPCEQSSPATAGAQGHRPLASSSSSLAFFSGLSPADTAQDHQSSPSPQLPVTVSPQLSHSRHTSGSGTSPLGSTPFSTSVLAQFADIGAGTPFGFVAFSPRTPLSFSGRRPDSPQQQQQPQLRSPLRFAPADPAASSPLAQATAVTTTMDPGTPLASPRNALGRGGDDEP